MELYDTVADEDMAVAESPIAGCGRETGGRGEYMPCQELDRSLSGAGLEVEGGLEKTLRGLLDLDEVEEEARATAADEVTDMAR